ncbi:hypothetical protein Nmel_014811 [Mimus melanotis]
MIKFLSSCKNRWIEAGLISEFQVSWGRCPLQSKGAQASGRSHKSCALRNSLFLHSSLAGLQGGQRLPRTAKGSFLLLTSPRSAAYSWPRKGLLVL